MKLFLPIYIFSVTLGCGGTSSDNITYIEQASTSSLSTNPCNYKICPCSTNICRIRYDFQTFTIASAPAGTNADGGAPADAGKIPQ